MRFLQDVVLKLVWMSHSISEEAPWAQAPEAKHDVERIYNENIAYVWRVLLHLGVPKSDVADVAHDVFLTVRRRLSSFQGRSSLRTWIYGISVRTVSDYRDRAYRRRELPHEEVPEPPVSSQQHDTAETAQLRATLQQLLAELKPEQREVFVLYEIEELGMKEVAEAVGCPLQTAYSRLHAARTYLKGRLESAGVKP